MMLPLGSAVLLAAWMAERSVTVPAGGFRMSATLLTLNVAGTQRSSRMSTAGRQRRRPRRRVAWGAEEVRANSLGADIVHLMRKRARCRRRLIRIRRRTRKRTAPRGSTPQAVGGATDGTPGVRPGFWFFP